MLICETCKKDYKAQESTSFFNFRFCCEKCEEAAEQLVKEVSMYICNIPLVITLCDDTTPIGKEAIVEGGTKWRREDKQMRGLNAVHLVNLSGKVKEKISWLELDEQTLEKHFLKV